MTATAKQVAYATNPKDVSRAWMRVVNHARSPFGALVAVATDGCQMAWKPLEEGEEAPGEDVTTRVKAQLALQLDQSLTIERKLLIQQVEACEAYCKQVWKDAEERRKDAARAIAARVMPKGLDRKARFDFNLEKARAKNPIQYVPVVTLDSEAGASVEIAPYFSAWDSYLTQEERAGVAGVAKRYSDAGHGDSLAVFVSMKVAFDARRLLKVLKKVKESHVVLRYSKDDANGPVLIHGFGASVRHILMPIRMREL